MNINNRGLLIALEGLDRAGKSTQAKRLVDYFQSKSKNALLIRFPERSTPTGKLIDAYLKGNLKVANEVIHLLFSSNRWEYKDKIIEELNRGTNIILDRYAYSGAAFTSAKGLDIEWCKGCDKGLPRPDMVFYMKIDAEELTKRGGFGDEIYEKQEFQEKVKEKFECLKEENWIEINCNTDIETVYNELLTNIENYLLDHKDNIYRIDKLWL